MSRLQFTTGAGHRRGSARQTRFSPQKTSVFFAYSFRFSLMTGLDYSGNRTATRQPILDWTT